MVSPPSTEGVLRMTPTLLGRIQSRLFLLLVFGLTWTIVVTPFLPAGDMALTDVYALTISAIVLTGIVGVIIWEPLYHLLQQLRWEKDWPTSLGLVLGLPEGLLIYTLLAGEQTVPALAFILHFSSTWILLWFAAAGPLRVLFLRWRYRGGRFD